jgi:hypothetical protein
VERRWWGEDVMWYTCLANCSKEGAGAGGRDGFSTTLELYIGGRLRRCWTCGGNDGCGVVVVIASQIRSLLLLSEGLHP